MHYDQVYRIVLSRSPFLRQRSFNRASQYRWREFADHRNRIASYLETPTLAGALCVLGAGNCNDLDLARLAARWPRILLADVDVEAMQSGVSHQFPSVPETIELTACDLTGALEHCHEIAQAPSKDAFSRLRRALTTLPAAAQLQQQFAVVASTCVLSQLIDIVRHAVGPTHPELASLAEQVRLQHLRTVAELTAPRGTMILFADFVSSDTLPELLHASDESLPALRDKALRENNCFAGMNPFEICRTLNDAPLASYWREPAAMRELWRWNLGPRTYLVTAITANRA